MNDRTLSQMWIHPAIQISRMRHRRTLCQMGRWVHPLIGFVHAASNLAAVMLAASISCQELAAETENLRATFALIRSRC